MSRYIATAQERIRTLAASDLRFVNSSDLRSFMESKGYSLSIIKKLAERSEFGRIFRELVFQNHYGSDYQLNAYAASLSEAPPSKSPPYVGSDEQNHRIDAARANSGVTEVQTHGQGATTLFRPYLRVPYEVSDVSIAIVGYGAAGILLAHALRAIGFRNITVFEKAHQLGIWSYENVHRLSRNNPRNLNFFDRHLSAAPGTGEEVRYFLSAAVTQFPIIDRVVRVTPGKLHHEVTLASGETHSFPIVINATGFGKPKPVSDPDRMITKTGLRYAGARWQQKISPEDVVGKRVVLIGLGNSTAEMLRQIHDLIDRGHPVDYRVLTHYPVDVIHNPTASIPMNGKVFRVFRDISIPNLVDYQGDLPLSRYDYFRALHKGKIVADVRQWEVPAPGVMSIFAGKKHRNIPFDKAMTLIGYSNSEEAMHNFGCTYDPVRKCGVFDYDGEVAANPGHRNASKRIYKGYFGFGSVLETPLNPNAIVIPGMMHRLGDLLFGITMRAAEYNRRRF